MTVFSEYNDKGKLIGTLAYITGQKLPDGTIVVEYHTMTTPSENWALDVPKSLSELPDLPIVDWYEFGIARGATVDYRNFPV